MSDLNIKTLLDSFSELSILFITVEINILTQKITDFTYFQHSQCNILLHVNYIFPQTITNGYK